MPVMGAGWELWDVAEGLWRTRHLDWSPPWDPLASSFCVEAGAETIVINPLAPPAEAKVVWARLDRRPPTVVLVLNPHHIRDVDLFVARYGGRAYGPRLFFRHDIPASSLEPIKPAPRFRVDCGRSTTGETAPRRPSGCRITARSSLPTTSAERPMVSGSGMFPGIRNGCCPPCGGCWNFPSTWC
ncbi:MAG: hypothetical protein JOZ69_06290 [Myxococcales bacterium]|nr:hypothetical protein [Myxococcales bacterium]